MKKCLSLFETDDKRQKTVVSKFRKAEDLLGRTRTELRYVGASAEQRGFIYIFDSSVSAQLRCAGVVAAVEMTRAGYPTDLPRGVPAATAVDFGSDVRASLVRTWRESHAIGRRGSTSDRVCRLREAVIWRMRECHFNKYVCAEVSPVETVLCPQTNGYPCTKAATVAAFVVSSQPPQH